MFSFNSFVRYSELDCYEKLNIYGILNYFQDCSTRQSENLGVGLNALHDENLVWVLSTWQIDVFRYPKLNENIVIGTFPYDFKGYFGRRNFIMKDEAGNTLAMADTMWTLLNYKEGKPSRITPSIASTYPTEEKLDMDYIKGKINIPDTLTKKDPITVKKHHLDANWHVNNGKYVEMILDEIEMQDFKRLRVEYRKQTRLSDVLTPYIYEDSQRILAVMKDAEDAVCTVLEFTK